MKNGKISHIERMRAQYHANRISVIWFTGMTDAQLSQFQFDTGLEWLTKYTAADDDVLRWVLSQPIIWKWWINEWNRRDEGIVELLHRVLQGRDAETYYRICHQEQMGEYTPNWHLLEEGYRKAICASEL